MIQMIYVELDGTEFARVKFGRSSTVAQLRSTLSKKHRLPPHTHFLDTRGYRLSNEDEDSDTIELLLDENDTVIMKNDVDIPRQRISANTFDTRKRRKESINEPSRFVINEILSIFSWLWCLLLKPMMVMVLMSFIVYYSYTKGVCHYGRSLPLVTMYCPIDPFASVSLPPLSKLAENSASIAETLIKTDVSIPMRCIQAKTLLVELRAKIIHSDIDINIRAELAEEMQQLENRVQKGADDLTDVLSLFHGALDRLKLYVKWGLDDLSKLNNSEAQNKNGLMLIGYSGMEQIARLNTSFQNYITSINREVDDVLTKAQNAQLSLNQIIEKLKTIQQINFKSRKIDQGRLDELQHGSFWSRLFDEGELGIKKHQRNINTLDEFVSFINNASNNISDIIIKLTLFKGDATNLKRMTAILNEVPVKSINEHAELLQSALDRLTRANEVFEGKLEETKRQKQVA